jgi:hypothetical protein
MANSPVAHHGSTKGQTVPGVAQTLLSIRGEK